MAGRDWSAECTGTWLADDPILPIPSLPLSIPDDLRIISSFQLLNPINWDVGIDAIMNC